MSTTSAPAKADALAIAALDRFSERGIDGVSMDDIAAAAGVTKGSLYWHYDSKKAIVLAACGQYYARWRTQMGAALESDDAPVAQLRAAVDFSVRSCLLDRGNRVFTTEIVALALEDDEVRSSWGAFLDETERLFLGLTHRAVGAGLLECGDVDQAVGLLLAAMEGVKQLALFRPQYGAADRAEQTSVALFSLLGRTAAA